MIYSMNLIEQVEGTKNMEIFHLSFMIVSEESGKLKIVDDELFELMVKNTGGK